MLHDQPSPHPGAPQWDDWRDRAVMDVSSDGIITLSSGAHGRIRTFNRAAERLFGYNAADAIGQPFSLLLSEGATPTHCAAFARHPEILVMEGGALGGACEVRGRRRDGSAFPLELTAAVIDGGDQGRLVVCIMRDITARKHVEETHTRQAALLDLSRDAIIVRSLQTGRIEYWNQGASTLYGWSPDEAVGQVVHTLLRTSFPQPREEIEEQVRRTGRWNGELGHSCRDRTRLVVDSRWVLERDDAGAPRAILEINRDIMEQKSTQIERMALLYAEKDYSHRLADLARLKDDFTSMVAHELASPIAAIQTLSAVLEVEDLPASQRVAAVALIRNQAAALAALTADVGSIATVERDNFAVHPLPTSLSALVGGAAAFAHALPGRHPVTTVVTAHAAEARVLADADRIDQVLRNLLSNAAKHTAEGTPIEIRATRIDGRARIEVADKGAGIAPDEIGDIFKKFGRARETRNRRIAGLGLGLYLSRQIIQAHGADLTVHSTLGEGAVMGFDLEVVP